MLATYVALHDIADVEGFVAGTIEHSGLRLCAEEHEELLAEGICILYTLADRFEPQRAGYASAGRFSGYAAQFLPRRLGDAWHKRHPEHCRVAGEDGKRHWRYLAAPLSFDQVIAPHPGAIAFAEDTNYGGNSEEHTIRPREHWAPIRAQPTSG